MKRLSILLVVILVAILVAAASAQTLDPSTHVNVYLDNISNDGFRAFTSDLPSDLDTYIYILGTEADHPNILTPSNLYDNQGLILAGGRGVNDTYISWNWIVNDLHFPQGWVGVCFTRGPLYNDSIPTRVGCAWIWFSSGKQNYYFPFIRNK